jgi:rhamnogalacturonan endolyase
MLKADHIFALGFICIAQLVSGLEPAKAQSPADAPVVITDNGDSVKMENGVVSLIVLKSNGNVSSMEYKGLNLMHGGEAYWNIYGSTPTTGVPVKTQVKGTPSVLTITQDPKQNGGSIGEFELLFPYHPTAAAGGENAPADSDDEGAGKKGAAAALPAPPEPLDIAIRYTLKRGDSGVYGWESMTHKPGYPAFDIEAGTVCLKLNPAIFDHLTVDSHRNKQMINGYDWMHGTPLNLKEARRMTTGIHNGEVEHKYDYSTVFSQTPAYGWSSSTKNVGVWIINPSTEYYNNGVTRVDYVGHIDLKDTPNANPTLLLIWHSFHFGGAVLSVGQDEQWNKIIGPFLIYCNSAATPDDMWKDALNRATAEKQAWPYDWAKAPGYANATDRGAVHGNLVVHDPQQADATASKAWVGLAAAPYTAIDQATKPVQIAWETDGKNYEYWAQADSSGQFTIKNARPGKYVLYAFNNGILGDFSKADVTVEAGKTTDLGTLTWTPVRYGRQLWDIGIPNRSAEEFRHGDHYWVWGNYNLYPQEFPNDVNFIIGKSDYSKDWDYAQPPVQDASGKWHGPTWKITFDMPKAGSGKATLRLALCGTRDTKIDVTLNGKPIGTTGLVPSSGVMHRDGIRSVEIYCDIPFDGSDLVAGQNVIGLTTANVRTWTQGVLYDYLRLELNDSGDK